AAPRARPAAGGARLYGLGAADTKGSIAATLTALDAGAPRDTAILLSGDEELAGTVLRDVAPTLPRTIAQAIVCEPTSCRAGTRHRGIVTLVASVRGEGGHSSRAGALPAPLADPAGLAVAWHSWGLARRDDGPPGFRGQCMNIAKLDGGVAFNVVPEAAELTISFRPPPGTDAAALVGELTAIAARTVPSAAVET